MRLALGFAASSAVLVMACGGGVEQTGSSGAAESVGPSLVSAASLQADGGPPTDAAPPFDGSPFDGNPFDAFPSDGGPPTDGGPTSSFTEAQVDRAQAACNAPHGVPDPYDTPEGLVRRLVGAWYLCKPASHPVLPGGG